MSNYLDILDNCEKLVQSGRHREALKELNSLSLSSVPRRYHVRLSNLLRAVNRPYQSLRLLYPTMHPAHPSFEEPSAKEVVSYAAALSAVGALDQATKLLEAVSADEEPKRDYYLGAICIRKWNYKEAITYYKNFMSRSSDPYAQLVAKVNILASHIFVRDFESAHQLVHTLERDIDQSQHQYLMGHLLELKAQLAILGQEFTQAGQNLDGSDYYLKEGESRSALFVKKWKSVLAMRAGKENWLELMKEAQEVAVKEKSWETIRDLDRYIAIGIEDKYLFSKVYHGTPFKSYRSAMDEEPELRPSPEFYLNYGDGPAPHETILNTIDGKLTGRLNGQLNHLKPFQLLHRLLMILSADFYRPYSFAYVHDKLFPNEYFNPETSPDRVYQVVKRFNKWCENSELPLGVQQPQKGFYKLLMSGPISIKTSLAEVRESKKGEGQLLFIKTNFGENDFSADELATTLNTSKRSALRLIKEELLAGNIEKVSSGPRTRYKLCA